MMKSALRKVPWGVIILTLAFGCGPIKPVVSDTSATSTFLPTSSSLTVKISAPTHSPQTYEDTSVLFLIDESDSPRNCDSGSAYTCSALRYQVPIFFLSFGSYIGNVAPDRKLSLGVSTFDGVRPYNHDLVPIQPATELYRKNSWFNTLSNRSEFNQGEDYDSAITYATGLLKAYDSKRKVLVILTDGSMAAFNQETTQSIRDSIFLYPDVEIHIVLLCSKRSCLPADQETFWMNDIGSVKNVMDVYSAGNPYQDWFYPLVDNILKDFLPAGEFGWVGDTPTPVSLDASIPSKLLYVLSLGDELPWLQVADHSPRVPLARDIAYTSDANLNPSPDNTCQFPKYNLHMPENQVGFFWLIPRYPEMTLEISEPDLVNGSSGDLEAFLSVDGWPISDIENAQHCYGMDLQSLDAKVSVNADGNCISPAICFLPNSGRLYTSWKLTPAETLQGDVPLSLTVLALDKNQPMGHAVNFSAPMIYEPYLDNASYQGSANDNPSALLAEDTFLFDFQNAENLFEVYAESDETNFALINSEIVTELPSDHRVDSYGNNWGCPSSAHYQVGKGTQGASTSGKSQMLYSISAPDPNSMWVTLRTRNFMTEECGFKKFYFVWGNGDHIRGVTWECLLGEGNKLACGKSPVNEP